MAAGAVLVLGANAASAAPSVGACAWGKVSAADKAAFLTAYHTDISQGLMALNDHVQASRASVGGCLGRQGAPGLWADSAVGAEAIEEASLAELKALKGLDRAAMERAWAAAPESARECTRANAGKVFGIGAPCADGRAPLAFLAPLKIVVAPEDEQAVRQALYYFTAKAQGEWAEQLLAKFKTDGLPPAAAAPATAGKLQ